MERLVGEAPDLQWGFQIATPFWEIRLDLYLSVSSRSSRSSCEHRSPPGRRKLACERSRWLVSSFGRERPSHRGEWSEAKRRDRSFVEDSSKKAEQTDGKAGDKVDDKEQVPMHPFSASLCLGEAFFPHHCWNFERSRLTGRSEHLWKK